MNKLIKKIIIVALETSGITGLVLFSVLPVSCKVSTQGIQIIGGNYKAPQLLNINVVDDSLVTLDFSKEIKLKDVVVSPFFKDESDSYDISETENLSKALEYAAGLHGALDCSLEYENNNKTARIVLNEKTEIGKKYEIYGVVYDKTGNSLTFCVPFTGFNSRIVKLRMTEIHPAMAAVQKKEDSEGTRRLEYVELLVEAEGNLAGLELCSGYAGEDKSYVFPAVEVAEGEIIVVHLRNWGEGCISEEGDNLEEAFSRYSGPYRDLWTEATAKPMHEKNDVLVLRNSVTKKIMDAVMYSDYSIDDWSQHLKTDFTLESDFSDFYPECSVSKAWSSAGVGTTKVIALDVQSGVWSVQTPSPGSL